MPDLILACLSGTLLALAFPYPSLWPLAWVALIPLYVAVAGRGVVGGFGLGYAFGLCFMGITLRWSAELDETIGWVLWALFVAIEALAPALFGALAAWLLARRSAISGWRPVAIACAWTSIEYMRVQGPYALTWSQLSYSQLPTVVMVQMADLTGAIGLTWLIVLVNAVLAEFVLWRTVPAMRTAVPASLRTVAIGSAILLLAAMAYGLVRPATLPAPQSEASVIACVQPNDDPHQKWNRDTFRTHLTELMGRLEEATARASHSGDDPGAYLVIWPETALPEQLTRDPEILDRVRDLARRLKVYLLVGCTEAPPASDDAAAAMAHFANTALLFGPDGTQQGRYDKMHLVPFGEFLPMRKLLEKIPPFNEVGDLYAGTAPTIFRTSRFNFATLICFESTFSNQARDFVRAGADLLVVITNDGWFNRTSAAEHHVAMTAMRAIEERIWVVQCGNTGVSTFIGPRGETYASTALFVPTEIKMAIQPGSRGSVYQRYGDWFPLTAALGLIALAGVRIRNGQL